MAEVRLLEKSVAERIAAGEVVERPVSVIKELVENSLDAACTKITVEIEDGGKELIRVVDDGHGMSSADVLLAVQRFATSKISQWEDLQSLGTLGFRGEALPSIGAVSHLQICTCLPGAEEGSELNMSGAGAPAIKPCAAVPGTRISVRNLFYNTPARLKFLRSSAAETAQITDLLGRMAAAWPEVGFRLVANGREVFSYPVGMSVAERLGRAWKVESNQFVPVSGEYQDMWVDGYVALPGSARSNRSYQLFLINGRIFRSTSLSQALNEGFSPLLERGRFPVGLIRLTIDPATVDVNVHPNKMEVRFVNDRPVFTLVYRAVAQALEDHSADSVVEHHMEMTLDQGNTRSGHESFPSTSVDVERQHVSRPLIFADSRQGLLNAGSQHGPSAGSQHGPSSYSGNYAGGRRFWDAPDTTVRHTAEALELFQPLAAMMPAEPSVNDGYATTRTDASYTSARGKARSEGEPGNPDLAGDSRAMDSALVGANTGVAGSGLVEANTGVAGSTLVGANVGVAGSTLVGANTGMADSALVEASAVGAEQQVCIATGATSVTALAECSSNTCRSEGDATCRLGLDAEGQEAARLPGFEEQSCGQRQFVLFGQLYNTYIVGLVDGELWVVDQHTAHERVNYEHLGHLSPLSERSQMLLIPEVMEFAPSVAEFLADALEGFREFGFVVEPFGQSSFNLRGIPAGLPVGCAVRAFAELVEEMARGSVSVKQTVPEEFREKLRAMTSCKAAVKAGDPLSEQEMRSLMRDMLGVEHSLYCPHGRPTRIRMGKRELERLFHR